jgi:hypothetical protein
MHGPRRAWPWVVVAAAVSLGLIVALAVVPLRSTRQTTASAFGDNLLSSGAPAAVQIGPNHFCAPSGAVGPGHVSFEWRLLGGAKASVFRVYQYTPGPNGTLLWQYSVSNVSSGSDGLSTAPPFDCAYPIWFFVEMAPGTVSLWGNVSYNYTLTVPLI